MHLAIYIFIVFTTWKWADWKNWKKYHTTMLFLSLMGLVYDFLAFSSGYFLWKAVPDFPANYAIIELCYAAVLLPCTVLLFLSAYPNQPKKIVLYFLKYIVIYSIAETLLFVFGRMKYQHGWSIWHSIAFYFLMFPAIIIHFKKPILAYIVFILITLFGVWYFQMPIK